jgi:hypothetical protein
MKKQNPKVFTSDHLNLSRELSRRGVHNPGERAVKLLGIDKAVKRKYLEEYLHTRMEE